MSLLLSLLAQADTGNPFPSYKGPTAVVAGFGTPGCVKTTGNNFKFLPENQCQNATKAFESFRHRTDQDKPCPGGTVSLVQAFSEPGCQGQIVVARGSSGACLNYTASAGGQSLIFSCVPDNPKEMSQLGGYSNEGRYCVPLVP